MIRIFGLIRVSRSHKDHTGGGFASYPLVKDSKQKNPSPKIYFLGKGLLQFIRKIIYSSKKTGSLVFASMVYGKEYAGTNIESFTRMYRISSPCFT